MVLAMLQMMLAVAAGLLVVLDASPASAGETVRQAIKAPGSVVLMRHAEAPGFGDPPNLRIGDCATQRNLDERGRTQARRAGEALRRSGIAFDRVLSSQWCRCLETAELVSGRRAEELPALNSFFGDRSVAPARVAEIMKFLGTLRPAERVLLVTHQVVIQALVGTGASSGEMVVVRLGERGKLEIVAKGKAED
jgi:phosphohistidine phosphatase SixA